MLIEYFTKGLYENVCRSLFEKDKLTFSFLLTINILIGDNKVNPVYWIYLLAGYGGELEVPKNPSNFLESKSWPTIYRNIFGMDKLNGPFEGILDYFMKNVGEF